MPVLSAPSSHPNALEKRTAQLVGCDGDKATKSNQALKDMVSLAYIASARANADRWGFKHYFRDNELEDFKNGMWAINQNDKFDSPYKFVLNCQPTGDVLKDCGDENKKTGSYAVTDHSVSKGDDDLHTIWLCPRFFNPNTGPDSKNDLPPTTDDGQKLQAWCNQDNYKSFVTAGHVLLHEITHLDAVAKQWLKPSNPKDPNDPHGTTDFALGSSAIESARRLRERLERDPNNKKDPAPAYNAESYAGAATELWAENFCKKEFIPPKQGWATNPFGWPMPP